MSGLVRVGHHDEAVGPADVDDLAVALVDGLDVVDAGGNLKRTRPAVAAACVIGSPRSPARWIVKRDLRGDVLGAVEHANLERELGRNTCGSCAANAATSANARPLACRGILTPRAIVASGSTMDVYLVPSAPTNTSSIARCPDEAPADEGPAEPDEPHRPISGGSSTHPRILPADAGWLLRHAGRGRARAARGTRRSAEPPTWWMARTRRASCAGWRKASPSSACSGTCATRRPSRFSIPTTSTPRRRDDPSLAACARTSRRHRFWLIIDALLFVASGVVFFVPGPNVIAYYFAFRLVGHYLLPARRATGPVGGEWTTERSAPLGELRRAIALSLPIASSASTTLPRLRLEHLASFVERTVLRSQAS